VDALNLLPRSIALRLTLALGAIALMVFSGTGILLHRSLADALVSADHDELLGKIEVVKHFVGEARTTGDLVALRHHLDDLLIGHPDLRVWLQFSDGTPAYGGPPPKPTGTLGVRGHFRLMRADGVPMDGVDAQLLGTEPLGNMQVRVAIDIQPRDQLLARYRNVLIGVCTLAVLLSVGLSALATWRGLAPVTRLSREASRITPHSLQTRLSDTHVDDELTGLVQAFNGVLDRLETAYRHMEAFNADVAHELRTPLATLINGTQVMLSAKRPAEELRDALASNLEELEKLKTLVNDMLFLARADQGDRPDGLEQVDLALEVVKTIEYCEALLEEGGVAAVREGAATAPCDASLIRRALVNLLSNAIKHTQRGQSIHVVLETLPGKVRLSVLNPGAPLSAELLKRMFDRFYRVDDARVRAGESHGLGLAIVRAIARMHRGEVFAHTTPAGNVVGLEIPGEPPAGAGQPDAVIVKQAPTRAARQEPAPRGVSQGEPLE
jgi:two-component system heavy metal sensor histidine kinase CusS